MRRRKGSTDVITYFKLVDSSTGTPKTALTYESTGIALYYTRSKGSATSVSPATQTATGNHSDGGFVKIDDTNTPGLYRVDWPDAAFTTGVDEVVLMVKATGVDPAYKEVELTDDPKARPTGLVGSGATTTSITTNLTEATSDHYKDAFLLITSGACVDQCRKITAYNGSSKALTVDALTDAPSENDTFVIINQ